MAEQALLDYIKSARITDDDSAIRDALISAGWAPAVVGEAFTVGAFGSEQTKAPTAVTAISIPERELATWDPLPNDGAEIYSLELGEQDDMASDLSRIAKYRTRPYLLKLYLALFTVTPILFTILSLVAGVFDFHYLVIFLPALFYFSYIRLLSNHLINSEIAKQEGWIYSSEETVLRWSKLAMLYPEIFQKGDNDQTVSEEMWGTLQNAPFWLGCFDYAVGEGKNREDHSHSVYAFPLPRAAPADFLLEPKSWGSEKRDLETESIDFNKNFSIQYAGARAQSGPLIFQTLTPPALEKIVALRAKTGPFSLLFSGKTMVISFGEVIKPRFTNFFIRVEVDPRDIQELEGRLKQVITLAGEILPAID